MTRVLVSDNSYKKTEKQSSTRSMPQAPVSREVKSFDHEIDMETIEQLRSDQKLRRQLKEHGLLSDLSNDSTDSNSSSFDDTNSENSKSKKKRKKKHKHKKRSGINANASDKVRNPQKWPHAHLQF